MKTRSRSKLNSQQGEEGLTIIEGLLAMAVVGVLIVAIGPVLAFAAATRVHARRVEQASEATRSYIDAVKNDMTLTNKQLVPPISTTLPSDIPAIQASSLNCPEGNKYCTSPADSQYKFYCVNFDDVPGCTANSPKDLVIQAFGFQPGNMGTGLTNEQRADKGYVLGVRVYRAFSFGKSIQLKAGTDAKLSNTQNKNMRASVIAGGSGNLSYPLAELNTEIVGTKNTYSDWKARKNNP